MLPKRHISKRWFRRMCDDCKLTVWTEEHWAEFYCATCSQHAHCDHCVSQRATGFCSPCITGACTSCFDLYHQNCKEQPDGVLHLPQEKNNQTHQGKS
jgi:hypothetical protein